MGTKEIIGHIECPVCGHDMPVKEDKNRHAYGHCAHRCNAQVFTRNDHRNSLLRQKMRPVTVTVPEPVQKDEPVQIPKFLPPAPAPAPAPKAAEPAPPAPPAPPEPARKRATWFNPVLGVA